VYVKRGLLQLALDQHYIRETAGMRSKPSFSKWLAEQILAVVEAKDRELGIEGSGPVEAVDLESIREAAARGAATGVVKELGSFALQSGTLIAERLLSLERRIADMESAVVSAVDSIEREHIEVLPADKKVGEA
jgi:hypothetical protein